MVSLSLTIFAPIFLALPVPFQVVTILIGGFFSFGMFNTDRMEVQQVQVQQMEAAAEIAPPGDGWVTKEIKPQNQLQKTQNRHNAKPATPAKRHEQIRQELQVSVPAGEVGGDAKLDKGEIVVNVRENGDIVIGKTVMDKAQLFEKLKRIATVHNNQAIRILGDGKVEYQKIVEVIDVCQKSGIPNISFATQEQRKK